MKETSRNMLQRWGRILAATVALAGCGEGQSAPLDWVGTMDTLPGGVVRVSNPRRGIWSGTDAWTLTQDLRLGRMEGDAPDAFWKIVDFAVSPQGEILVVDQAQEVRQFRSAGELVRTIGHKGEGPGEFANAIGIAFDPDGNAWVADDRLRRYSVFGPDGTLNRIVPMPGQGVGAFEQWRGVFDSSGRLYEISIGAPSMTELPFTAIRIDESEHVDTLPALSFAYPLINGFPPSPDIVRRLVFTFGDAGTVWIAYTDQYRLVQLRLDSGDTLRIVETPFDLIPLMDAERDSAFRQLAPVGVRPEQIPTTRPVIHNLHRGPEGTLLVQLATSPQATESVFDVFDGEGRLLGRLRTPVRLVEGFLEPSARVYPDGIYGVVSDNLGVESLVRYRINRPSS